MTTPTEVYVPSDTSPPPHPDPRKPSLRLPAGTCDAHCHIFGPGSRFPYAVDRTFTPRDSPKEALAAIHEFLGIQRAVVVQASCNGFDHAVLLDALRDRPDSLRGIALIHAGMTSAELAELDGAGVKGFRVVPVRGRYPGAHEIQERAALVQPFGWHTQLLVPESGIVGFAEVVRGLPGTVVLDHLAGIDPSHDVEEQLGVVFGLLDSDSVWVKVSGADRVTQEGAPYDDAVAIGRRIVAHRPDRVVWGTDYPHVNMQPPAPDDGLLTDLIPLLAPDESVRQRMLVDNPAALYGY